MDTVESMEKSPARNGPLSNRIVHFDLKGAPPKISYLLELIPLVRQWGATGILVEYEDMFPYKNKLSVLSKPFAYSSDDLKLLQEATKLEGMDYIPLLQSFGHVEFILKHHQFEHLREASINPMSLCPKHVESLPLIEEIVDQFMQEHPDIEYLHIGGDEVFCINVCKKCVDSRDSIPKLYLSHMEPLILFIQNKFPTLKLFVWDDMFREFSVQELEELSPQIIPMVWSYVDYLDSQFPNDMWRRYGSVFEEIWIATSFKGSSGPTCDLVPIQHHVNNHLSWFNLIESFDQELKVKIKGVAVTGWSRYDHFATLCELLPAAFPCLVLCLQVLRQGSFTRTLHENVSKSLGYVNAIPLSGYFNENGTGNFPGSELIGYICQLEFAKRQLLVLQERSDGWMDDWHTEVTQEVNLGHIDFIYNLVTQIIQLYESIRGPIQECLSTYFYEETALEVVKSKIDSKLKVINLIMDKVQTVKSFKDK
eukprot:TCONS_00006804-protein